MSDLERYSDELRQRAEQARVNAERRRSLGQFAFAVVSRPFATFNQYLASRNSKTRDHLWTWLQIRTGEEVVRWFLIAGLTTAAILCATMFDELRDDIIALAHSTALWDWFVLACYASVVLFLALAFVDAARYRNWRRRMPFPVLGWESLVDQERFEYNMWWPCSLTVRLVKPDPALGSGVRAALEYYCLAADRMYYYTQDEDSRFRWRHGSNDGASDKAGLTFRVTGYANNRVPLRMYQLIRGPLRKLHQVSGGIESVELQLTGEGEYISTGDD